MSSKYYLPVGSAATGPFDLEVTPESAGWTESSLRVLTLPLDGSAEFDTGAEEILVVPLSGSVTVSCATEKFVLAGRRSVFDGPTDFAYVGIDSAYRVTASNGGRFALCGARARQKFPSRYVPAADVSVELRGAGSCSRQVHNFATADRFEADSIIACEVITPGGNWSSYPSHKHDENSAVESRLEEIYYFEIAQAHSRTTDFSGTGFGYHRVYGTPARPIEVLEEVRTGDVVLVPHGYHGPSIAAPGHHMYYLNVMAGPGDERSWKICDDPAHAWVRTSWEHQTVDPRLPLHRSTFPKGA
ncbi:MULTISPECIES: 5-deoxy-glucuronate isomerase [Rhodococcus]|uniref:5-deoxy-glucuronate isomerase n=1 Tax=Rhodococcus oxybenzonivorans TaxID=1990687 RepID=A0AAE4UW89_9NOCA|nr:MULTISPECIES: 5-deoxy-glucuronate isomerase [Rhodococcus]MDV7244423.1 5-deoxy-glucuronate isomerase [Rhodococcus oxybenzonivorans]MDV7263418.1 5-deoxy-glucuronate isomerase [Rhodococcus oxybenzonivorans]MDV7274334.1 5-deoxy-glucuronate isomerase [Rhodococcus oxybenzonivorans]MDV7335647.1 5-deoxy-glucuronate isomerase [Rhodococcus oxybenzonivorans]MDV7345284.1 5-deoxy-glucuronate isomerase [Rhodococcus oxybenzonivorans]